MSDKERFDDTDFREVVPEDGKLTASQGSGKDSEEDYTSKENIRASDGSSGDPESDKAAEGEEGHQDDNEYEDICYICHRPESKAGAMIKISNGICI